MCENLVFQPFSKKIGFFRAFITPQQTIYTVQHPKNAPYLHLTCTVQVQYMHCTSTLHTLYMHCTCTVLYSALMGLCNFKKVFSFFWKCLYAKQCFGKSVFCISNILKKGFSCWKRWRTVCIFFWKYCSSVRTSCIVLINNLLWLYRKQYVIMLYVIICTQ